MRTDEFQRLPARDIYKKHDRILPGLVDTIKIPDGMLQDVIYDLQRTQVQLREHITDLQVRNKDLAASTHMIAHDLKDLLAVLVLSSDLITDVPDLTPQEMDESLQQIKSTVNYMNRIITSLLLFGEVSKADAPVEVLDMTRIVANVQDRLSHLIKEHQAQIKLPEAWPDSVGYAPWVEEVWANYISNAVKHGGQPPYVELGASIQPDGMVRFWTRDNGPGLPPDARGRLFTPFSQINSIRNLGHGVGLSIVLHIIEKLGGHVGVESEPGKGCLFFFTLPACP